MIENAALIEDYLRNGTVPPNEAAHETHEVAFEDLSKLDGRTIGVAELQALLAGGAAAAGSAASGAAADEDEEEDE